MNSIKEFKDQNGNVLALAAIPDDYTIGSALNNEFQHKTVPFFITAHAINRSEEHTSELQSRE